MPTKRTPCENCRRQHVKCNGYPICTRCQKSGKECKRVEQKWRFRHAIPAEVRYVDETAKFTGGSRAKDQSSPNCALSPRSPHTQPSPSFSYLSATIISPAGTSASNASSQRQAPLLQTHDTAWPRLGPRDACLLRYFVEDLGTMDPERHFASVVPKKSRECPALLDAILAVAARHFSTLPASRKSQLLIHYGLSITQLRDLASGPDAIMDESLLAAVVALRFFEELDTPFINTPTETGVQGVNVFLRAQAPMALHATGLRAAAFWVGFRQEFNMAFSQQRPIRLPRDLAESYLLWTPAADHIWTNRLIVIGTHVLEYCYRANKPEEGDHSRRYDYDELVHLREEWTSQRPGSFEPVYAEQPRLPLNPRQLQNSEQQQNHPWDAIFPKIWFLDPAHIVAGQTLGLLDILLKAYSPYTPRVGPSRRAEMEAADAQIRRIVLDVCGMGLSNRQSPTAGLTACIAIIICADWFVDAGIGVQKALMEVVIRTTEENNYWPTGESQVRLRRAWGWDE